jgi:hypothetical protein
MIQDLSPVSIVCAWIIYGLSLAHIYHFGKKNGIWLDLIHSVVAWMSLVGPVLSTIPFVFWQALKKQPQQQNAYFFVLVMPWVYGLCVEVGIHFLRKHAILKRIRSIFTCGSSIT